MPNVLLLGCSKGLLNALQQDPAWSVALGVHRGTATRAEITGPPPDPTFWDIVVDDCGRETSDSASIAPDGAPVYSISDTYLEECDRAHIVRSCGVQRHLEYQSLGTGGERLLVLRPGATENAGHLSEFVEVFEHDFYNHQIRRVNSSGILPFRAGTELIFKNYYRQPVIVLTNEEPPILLLPNIPDDERRQQALLHFIERTAGRIWPEIWSDTYQPRRAARLEAELDELIASTRLRRTELEDSIHEARTAYAPYAALIRLQGDALKNLVARVFTDVFGMQVTDLDAGLAPNEPKRLDLLIEEDAFRALAEVRGSSERNAQVERDLDRFQTNLRRLDPPPRTTALILVFNGRCGYPMDERKLTRTFSTDVVSEAEDRGICLVSTYQLLQVIEAFWEGDLTKQAILAALSSPGLFALAPDFGPQSYGKE